MHFSGLMKAEEFLHFLKVLKNWLLLFLPLPDVSDTVKNFFLFLHQRPYMDFQKVQAYFLTREYALHSHQECSAAAHLFL